MNIFDELLPSDEANASLVANMTAMCGMISWTGILWTSIRWNKGLEAQGIDRKTLPYMAPFQPYLSYCKFKDGHFVRIMLIAATL